MAIIKLETNISIPEDSVSDLARDLGNAVAEAVDVPATDITVELTGKCEMRMASEAGEARCHIRIIGIEFPMEKAKNLSTSLYSIIDEFLAISEHGIYMAVVTNRHTMSRLNPNLRSKTAVRA